MNSIRIRRAWALAGALASASGASVAAEDAWRLIMQDIDAVAATDVRWVESHSIPSGTKMIMLYGHPGEAGPYIFRVQFPAGYKLPAHRHADQRSVTVLRGTYWSGVGETFDPAKLRKFGPRDYYITDAGVPHFSWAETEVVIQEMGIGPIGDPIEYVDPADDPRK